MKVNMMRRCCKSIFFVFVLLAFLSCAERKAKSDYKTAEELFKGGSYKEAVAKYMEVIKYDKDIPEVEDSYYKLGIIYSKYLEDPATAVFYLEEFVKRFPKTAKMAEVRKEIGYTYLYKLNKPEKALEEFEFISKNYPQLSNLDEIVYLKGQAYLAQKKFDLAEQTYSNFGVVFKNSKYVEEVEYKLGLIKLNLGKNKEAIEQLKKFTETYPSSSYCSMAKFDLGTAYENMGDYKKALEIYKSIGNDYPNQEALKIKIQKLEERFRKKSKPAVTRTPKYVKEQRKSVMNHKVKRSSNTTKKKKK